MRPDITQIFKTKACQAHKPRYPVPGISSCHIEPNTVDPNHHNRLQVDEDLVVFSLLPKLPVDKALQDVLLYLTCLVW